MADDAPSYRTGLLPAVGRLVVASTVLDDPNFRRTVVYLLEHDGNGTVGLVLNRPSRTPVGQVLPDWHDAMAEPQVVFTGGPVQVDGALCLAELPAGSRSATKQLLEGLGTVDLDAEPAAVTGSTGRLRMFAGHSGWGAGQLEGELEAGAWFVVEGRVGDVFDADPRGQWRSVLRRQSGPLRLLSSYPAEIALN